jgi:hypothetical protein
MTALTRVHAQSNSNPIPGAFFFSSFSGFFA